MPPQSTAALLAARRAARRAEAPASSPAPGGPMFSTVGQDAPRRPGASRVVLAIAAVGLSLATLSLAREVFGWGRPQAPVRVQMMADEADAAARALDAPPPPTEPP
jgi:hypothetical protein